MEMPQSQTKVDSVSSQIPGRGLYSEKARLERIDFLRSKTGAPIQQLSNTNFSAEALKGNVENFIGSLTIPIGVAGPLLIQKENGETEEVFAPIATTEGALVASITRGARAITLSGGVRAKAIRQKMTRVPMFEFESLFQAVEFTKWIEGQFGALKQIVKKYSNYSELTEIEAKHLGRSVHLRFVYTTQDAAGQNMTTICTWNACQWLLAEVQKQNQFDIKNFILDGNLSADKKAAFGSIANGRGTEVIAEAVIKGSVLEETLKISVDQLVHVTNLVKSARIHSGLLGWNINVANVLAGIFAATGQDIACVHESSVGEFHLEPQIEKNGEKNLYISIHLPCLIVGTIGGGTRLPVQAEMLEMMDCQGEGKAERLAELIASFCLALDVSTLCAMAGGQFADAHSRLGRSSLGQWLKRSELNSKFITDQIPDLANAKILSVEPIQNAQFGNSLVMDLSSQVTQKLCGFFPYKITYQNLGRPELEVRNILLKIKPKDEEVMIATEMMASMCDHNVKKSLVENRDSNIFQKNHIKEVHVNQLPELKSLGIAPKIYGSLIDENRQIYMLIQEFETQFAFEPGAEDTRHWNARTIQLALENISRLHGVYYNQVENLKSQDWIGYRPNQQILTKMKPLFMEMAKFGFREFPDWISKNNYEKHLSICQSIESWSAEFQSQPQTLIHNDFNPRNIGLVRENENLKVRIFDWELATVAPAQRDVVELLSFVLSQQTSPKELLQHLTFHRVQLQTKLNLIIDEKEYLEGALVSLYEFVIHRLSLYFVAHSLKECRFLPRVYQTAMHLIDLLQEELNS